MARYLCLLLVFTTPALAQDKLPKPIATGLKNPESVAIGNDGRTYVTEIGEFGKDGDGRVVVVGKDGKVTPFAKDMDDPKGIVAWLNFLYVTDNKRVWRIDVKSGQASVFVAEKDFPIPPLFLNDITVDEHGVLYVSDSGDLKGSGGAIFRIAQIPEKGDGKSKPTMKIKVTTVTDGKRDPRIKTPNGLIMDGKNHLLMLDFGSGELLRIKLSDASSTKIAEGFDGGDGLAWDNFGRLFITSWKSGKVWGIARPSEKPVLLASGFESAADCCVSADGKSLLVPDMKAGTLTALPTKMPMPAVETIPAPSGAVPASQLIYRPVPQRFPRLARLFGRQPQMEAVEVPAPAATPAPTSKPAGPVEFDDTPMALKTEVAFPNLQWTGWKGETEKGKLLPLRPILLTHAGDGSNRIFVAIQQGTIHVFPNNPKAERTKVFLNIEDRVFYDNKENEQGLLGLAFHPKFKLNHEFFVFYTLKKDKTVNILSRFRVADNDPDSGHAATEEVLLRVKRPFWNHDGGTICFGPDGYLYVALGDGGAADDPQKHGQKLSSLLGKVLRIDVDRKDAGKEYAVPKDNPFVGVKDAATETWAYGLRNIWRMAFDRKTGKLWAGEVGQNLYEEINIIEKGGNYGWSIREGLHPFSKDGVDVRKDIVEPIWEYHHSIGKSITGGHVYRGKRLPELDGYYLYGDYITTKLWALKYDDTRKRVVANRPIVDPNVAIFSFGEDEAGEVYFLTESASGKGIYQFVRK